MSGRGINSENEFFKKIQEVLPSSDEIDAQRKTFQQLLYRVAQQANWGARGRTYGFGTILENYRWRFKQSLATLFSERSLYEANNHGELLEVLRKCVKRHDPENEEREQLLSRSTEIGYTNELPRAPKPPCHFFFTPSGCRNGDHCDFSHVKPSILYRKYRRRILS